MTSLPVKDIGAVMSRSATSGAASAGQSASSVSFESVWNNQTEKNGAETTADDVKAPRKEDDAAVRDSLKAKDSHKSVIKENESVEKASANDLRDMDPEEWEKAMEVLGAAAVEMIQQIADTFGMTVEEVQGLMSELGMEQLDVLQQENLGQLILAAGGAEGMTSLLTDEGLYQDYQALMEQLNGLLDEAGETLQMDVGQLMQTAMETTDEAVQSPVVEVTVEDGVTAGDGEDAPRTEVTADDAVNVKAEKSIGNVEPNEQKDSQMQQQTQQQTQEQGLNRGKEQTDAGQHVTENRAQGENLVLQNLKAEQFEPQLQQVAQTSSVWDADTVDIMRQIMDYMRIQVKPDMSNLEMQLHPANLGTLQIHVASKGGNVTAQFVTQNEAVKAALESQMIQLKESFAEQGVKVEAIEVTVQTHQFEQNLEQGRGRQQNETERKTRTRRIQLDGAFSAEELSELEEEEQLAAEMMAANGNTVDYTA